MIDVRARIEQRFEDGGSPARVPKARGAPFKATLRPDGVEVDNLGGSPLLPWAVFEETVALLREQGGMARFGDVMSSKLGDPGLPFDSIEGRIASKVYGREKGVSAFRRGTPVAGILVWADICKRVRGGLTLAENAAAPSSRGGHVEASEYRKADADDDLFGYLRSYRYHPELTSALDRLADEPFNQNMINEIVLWKVGRYVALPPALLARLNKLRDLKPGQHRRAETLLQRLLTIRGIDIAMASSILRFRNPRVFQIIDRHAYRALYGEDSPVYAGMRSERKIALYWDFLDAMRDLCDRKGLEFDVADRVLYEFDRRHNGKL